MTYCCGWKYRGAVYLLADTAATGSSPPTKDRSSFGQLHDQVRGKYVEESLLKLVPITSDTAIAFSGNVQLATEIIEFLKQNFDPTETFADLFAKVNASLGPFNPARHVSLIVAYAPLNAESQLIHWNSQHGLDGNQSDYYQIGSLTSYHAALTPKILSILASGQLSLERVLSMIIAVVQSYGIFSNLIDMNVGGIIFGLWVYSGSVTWQEDTNFFLYNPTFDNLNYISAFVRDNVLVVNSSFTNETSIFMHSVSTSFPQTWHEAWHLFVASHINSGQYRYWIFLSTKERNITVLCRNDFELENQYFSLQFGGDGNFILGLSPTFMALLAEPLRDLGDGSLPFRLNFKNA
jgi:hypothetical protein